MNFYSFLVTKLDYSDEKARNVIFVMRRIYTHSELRRYYKPENPGHPRPTESTVDRQGPNFWFELGIWQKFAAQNDLPIDQPPTEDFQLLP